MNNLFNNVFHFFDHPKNLSLRNFLYFKSFNNKLPNITDTINYEKYFITGSLNSEYQLKCFFN